MKQNFIRTLQVAKNTATTAVTAGVVPLGNALAEGDIVAVNADTGAVVTSLTGVKKVSFVSKVNGELFHSNPVILAALTNKSKKAYAAPVRSKKAIGYNGTTGTFAVENKKYYAVKATASLLKEASYSVAGLHCMGDSKSLASATQVQVCVNIADSFNVNALKNDVPVYANAITSAAPTVATGITAGTAGAGTLTLTNGSQYGVFATNILLETALVVDGYVGVLDAAAKFLILKVKAIHAGNNTVEFYSKYTGTTVTIATADFAAKLRMITPAAITGIATAAGIIFEGDTLQYKRGYKEFDMVTFDLAGNENTASTTVISKLANVSMGSGSGYIVADLEEYYRNNFTPYVTRSDEFSNITETAVLTDTYDIWNFTQVANTFTDGIGYAVAPIEITVALPTTRTAGTTSAAAASLMDLVVAL